MKTDTGTEDRETSWLNFAGKVNRKTGNGNVFLQEIVTSLGVQ